MPSWCEGNGLRSTERRGSKKHTTRHKTISPAQLILAAPPPSCSSARTFGNKEWTTRRALLDQSWPVVSQLKFQIGRSCMFATAPPQTRRASLQQTKSTIPARMMGTIALMGIRLVHTVDPNVRTVLSCATPSRPLPSNLTSCHSFLYAIRLILSSPA